MSRHGRTRRTMRDKERGLPGSRRWRVNPIRETSEAGRRRSGVKDSRRVHEGNKRYLKKGCVD